MTNPSDVHARFRNRIALVEVGLLTEAESEAFRTHAADCASCREAWEAYSGEPGEPADETTGHVPAALLARWHTGTDLSALERELVERHLASCEACREDLALVRSRASEPPGAVLRLDRHRRRAWFQGAAAGALVAAAAMAIVLRPGSPPTRSGAIPWVVPGTTRGAEAALAVPPGARRLLLAIPVPAAVSAGPLTVAVTGPDGNRLVETPVEPDRIVNGTLMLVLAPPSALEAGTYTVTVTPEGGEPAQSHFRLRITGS